MLRVLSIALVGLIALPLAWYGIGGLSDAAGDKCVAIVDEKAVRFDLAQHGGADVAVVNADGRCRINGQTDVDGWSIRGFGDVAESHLTAEGSALLFGSRFSWEQGNAILQGSIGRMANNLAWLGGLLAMLAFLAIAWREWEREE